MKNIKNIFPQMTQIRTDRIVKKNAFLSVLICTICGSLSAQTISLDDAIKMALQNNGQLKNEQLKSQYAKALINTAIDIPKTNVIAEYGQINSAYSDSKFGIAQSIALPTVYKKQKQLLTQDYNAALLSISLKEQEIKKAVTQAFYFFIYLKEKQKLLLQVDTLYTNFLQKAALRLQKGESNILEKTTAETQKGNITIQLRQVQEAIEISILELQLLLNTTQNIEPRTIAFKMPNILFADSNSIANHPMLKLIQQQTLIAQAVIAVEKTKLKPEFSLGYFNNSFKGTGADNKLYDGSNRFSSMQIGASIPIFTKGQKAKISAAKLNEQLASSNEQLANQHINIEYKILLTQYNSNINIVKFFEETGLKNAASIIQTANKQFVNGEINYLDFVTLTNQAITIQSNYIEAIKTLNESTIEINFITSK